MTVQVLLSCMHQKDASIIARSNIQSDVIVVNQCDEDRREDFTFRNNKGEECRAIVIYTTERGLSKSRNKALSLATADICIVCDDDETFADDYVEHITIAYEKYPAYGMIFFEIGNRAFNKQGYRRDMHLSKMQTLPICSVQITFRRKELEERGIRFNEAFGAGVSLAGGEEHLLMFDCIDKGIKCRNYPYEMAKLNPGSVSTWRTGYSRAFMEDEGKVLGALFGKPLGMLAALRFLWRKRTWITASDSFAGGVKSIYRGLLSC